MRIPRKSKLLVLALVCCLLATCITPVVSAAKVTPSRANYSVSMKNLIGGVYLCNKESIGTAVGTEYYMTYTVKSVTHRASNRQHGVIGTNVPWVAFPYTTPEDGKGGLMYYDTKDQMLTEGRTYFLKFTVTKDGYEYKIGWGQEEDSRYIDFYKVTGKVKSDLGFFGVWFEDMDFDMELIKVRCYDKYGNDLGVQTNRKEVTIYVDEPMQKDTKVAHSYDIKVENQYIMNISNKFLPTSNIVYMEYTVKSGSQARLEQVGVALTDAIQIGFPYSNGYLRFNQYSRTLKDMTPGPLLEDGASYIIKFEKKTDKLVVTAQKTKGGKTVNVDFSNENGQYNKDQNYFCIWLSGIGTYANNFELIDFKCYDSNKVNLGVYCNLPATITHHGSERDDYRGLDGIYYSAEKGIRLDLNADQSAVVYQDGVSKEGTFVITEDMVLTTTVDGVRETFDYFYTFLTDENGVRYQRMKNFKVFFDTGNGSEIPMQTVGAEENFLVTKPENPTLSGTRFVAWCTSDGTEFDFDSVITESITLYAKWENTNYVNVNVAEEESNWQVLLICGTAVLLAGVALGIAMIVRAKKYGKAD